MSNKTKLIISVLFLVQIGVIGWAYSEYKQKEAIRLAKEAAFQAKFAVFLENPKVVDSMDLSGQEIDRLLNDMQQFENLKYLDLSNNNFQKFPTRLLKLPKLEVLKMNNNQIEKVLFIQNNTLKRLYLNNNNINKIGDTNPLKLLEHIELNFNQLSNFPMVSQESKLDSILLNNNQLSKVFYINNAKVKPVSYIDFSHNNFRKRDGLEDIISHAVSINVRGNEFDEFPVNFLYGAGKVKKLDASNCQTKIFHVDGVISRVVEDLDISDNDFSIAQSQLNQFPKLKSLNISGLRIDNLQLSLDSLEQLNVENIILVSTDCTFTLPKLKELIIDNWFLELYLDNFKNSPLEIINIIEKEEVTNINTIQQAFPNAIINIIKSK